MKKSKMKLLCMPLINKKKKKNRLSAMCIMKLPRGSEHSIRGLYYKRTYIVVRREVHW